MRLVDPKFTLIWLTCTFEYLHLIENMKSGRHSYAATTHLKHFLGNNRSFISLHTTGSISVSKSNVWICRVFFALCKLFLKKSFHLLPDSHLWMWSLPYFSSICANNWVFELFSSVPVLTSPVPFWSGSCRREAARLSLQHGRDKLQNVSGLWLVNSRDDGFSLVWPATAQTSLNCSALRKSLHCTDWAPDCLPHTDTRSDWSVILHSSLWLAVDSPSSCCSISPLGWGQGSGSQGRSSDPIHDTFETSGESGGLFHVA